MAGLPLDCFDRQRVTPAVGSYVEFGEWGTGRNLLASDWEKAAFRVETGRPVIESLAVNVKVIGRTAQILHGRGWWVRIVVVFVGDGEPDQTCKGWFKLND